MSTEVIVAHEKHGTFTYSSAWELFKQRFNEGYWYDNWDDGDPKHQWEDRAKKLKFAGERLWAMDGPKVERAAWNFLAERKDHEYEYVEKQTVR